MHGYRVVLHGNRSIHKGVEVAKVWNDCNIETLVVQADISDESQVAKCCEQIVSTWNRIDVLVHTAAVWDPKPLEQTVAKDVLDQYASNTLGTFLCAKHAGLNMAAQESGGSIVLTGDWAINRPYRDFAAYFTSKGAIPTLTRSMAVELAQRNSRVRVNAVMPGPIMLPEGISDAKEKAIREQCLLKIHGNPDHLARTAVFLAEHEFLTGVCIPVDGGRSIYSGDHSDAVAHPDV